MQHRLWQAVSAGPILRREGNAAQIMAMSTMKDGERLELLKEVGGTSVYEERRRESLKILADTASRRARILEVVRALPASRIG